MRCPTCGRETPEALMVCRHCGAATRPSLVRRLFGWLRRPRADASLEVRHGVTPDEDPLGIEMPAAGAKAISLTVTQVSTGRDTLGAVEALPPALRDKVREMIASGGGPVHCEQVVRDDGTGEVTVSERGTPLDPEVRAAIAKLLESETATHEQRIVVETDGTRQEFESAQDMPPAVRNLLGRFADMPINEEGKER
jgi:hypothetical protein